MSFDPMNVSKLKALQQQNAALAKSVAQPAQTIPQPVPAAPQPVQPVQSTSSQIKANLEYSTVKKQANDYINRLSDSAYQAALQKGNSLNPLRKQAVYKNIDPDNLDALDVLYGSGQADLANQASNLMMQKALSSKPEATPQISITANSINNPFFIPSTQINSNPQLKAIADMSTNPIFNNPADNAAVGKDAGYLGQKAGMGVWGFGTGLEDTATAAAKQTIYERNKLPSVAQGIESYKNPFEGMSGDKNILENMMQLFTNNLNNAVEYVKKTVPEAQIMDVATKLATNATVNDTTAKAFGFKNQDDMQAALFKAMDTTTQPYYDAKAKLDQEGLQYKPAVQDLGNVAGNVGQMAPAIAIGALGQPEVALAAMSASAGGQSARQAAQNGANPTQAAQVGLANAALQYGTSKMFTGFNALPKGVVSNGLKSVLKGFTETPVGKAVMNAVDIGGAGVENMASQALQGYIDRAVYDPNAKVATWDEITNAGKMGVTISALLKGIGGGFHGEAEQASAAPKTIEDFKNGDASVQNNNINIRNGIKVGRATTIYNPYEGETPVNIEGVERKPVEISDKSIETANSEIEKAKARGLVEDKSPRNFLKNLYDYIFPENSTKIEENIQGAKFKNEDYTVDLNKNAVSKVVSDPNISAEKLAIFDSIGDIIKNAEYVGSSTPKSGSDPRKAIRFDHFETQAKIGEQDYTVAFDVAVYPNVNNYKTHRIINNMDLVSGSGAARETVPAAAETGLSPNHDITQPVSNVNTADSIHIEKARAQGQDYPTPALDAFKAGKIKFTDLPQAQRESLVNPANAEQTNAQLGTNFTGNEPPMEIRQALDDINSKATQKNADIQAIKSAAVQKKPVADVEQGKLVSGLHEAVDDLGFGVIDPGAKSVESTVNKVVRKKYNDEIPDYSVDSLKDHARASIMVNDLSDIPEAVRALKEKYPNLRGEVLKQKSGYIGYHLTMNMDNGVNAEIQIVTPESYRIKKIDDDYYKKWRDKPFESLTKDEIKKRIDDDALTKSLWNKYYSGFTPEVRDIASSSVMGLESHKVPQSPLNGIQEPSLNSNPRKSDVGNANNLPA